MRKDAIKNERSIRHKGVVFGVCGDQLHIGKDGIELVTLRVAPVIEGKETRLSEWCEVASDHLAAQVEGVEATVHLEVDHGHVCFHVETPVEHFERLCYFTDGRINGAGWQTYLSDVNDCFRSCDVDAEVPISSCFNGLTPDEADGEGMTDPGDHPPTWIWNVPLRALSLHTECGWLGLSLPGPLPVGVTRLAMKDRRFSMGFEALRPACEEGAMPRVYFLTGLAGAYDALEVHRDLSMALGWMVRRDSEQPDWWAQPTFKPAMDLFAGEQGLRVLYKNEQGEWASRFNSENFRKWVDAFIQRERLDNGARVILDQVFMYGYGSRRIIKELGGVEGFRAIIDEFRERGIRVGLYFHPYFVGMQEPFYKEHPECFCGPKDPSVQIQWCDTETLTPAYLDWTHAEGRARQLDYLAFLLSDKPGCLNADWLAFNNAEGPDPRLYDFHDPDWAIGDLLQFKVHRLVYERAKQIKPDGLVRRISAGACYLQPYVDQIEMMEHWMSGTAEWYKRGQIITRATQDMLFGTDPYFVTQTKGHEYWMAMMVWNIPEYGGLDKVIHPYTHWRDLPEKDRRRRTAGIQVYLNAPMNRTDVCRVTWEHGEMKEVWRLRSGGPLKGFYAALAISPRCFVTYSEGCARIGSSESRHARIPIPQGAEVKKVVRVLHEGGEQAVGFERRGSQENAALWIKVADCGYETLYTEIRYVL
jgi:hypothetical protein